MVDFLVQGLNLLVPSREEGNISYRGYKFHESYLPIFPTKDQQIKEELQNNYLSKHDR